MTENRMRVRAERGEVQIGTWITMIRTPGILTLLQAAGLDFARIDMEHGAFSMETVADMAALARALDFPLVVRPPEGSREWITRLLDAGVPNLHVPQVDTPEQALAVARAARYAPLGERGMYGFGPHTGYQSPPVAEHMAAANARVHVTVMLETKRAFDRLDEIAAVPGIDALTLGPSDLAQDLGVLGTPAQRGVDRRASPPPRRGGPAPREGRRDAHRQPGGGARDDRPRRDPRELLVGRRGAPLGIRVDRRQHPAPSLTRATAPRRRDQRGCEARHRPARRSAVGTPAIPGASTVRAPATAAYEAASSGSPVRL